MSMAQVQPRVWARPDSATLDPRLGLEGPAALAAPEGQRDLAGALPDQVEPARLVRPHRRRDVQAALLPVGARRLDALHVHVAVEHDLDLNTLDAFPGLDGLGRADGHARP